MEFTPQARGHAPKVPNIPLQGSRHGAPHYLRGMENPSPEKLVADQRILRIIWLAIASGVIIVSTVMAFLVQSGSGGTMTEGGLIFTINAALNVASILFGFSIQKKLDVALSSVSSQAEAMVLIRTRCILSIAVVEGSALFAVVATLLTGDFLNLAFVAPFFAFAWLFFPSDQRFAYWLALWRGDR